MQRNGRKSNTKKTHGYNLSYFNLWWSRMAVEGRRDAKVKERMEEEDLRVQRGRMMKSKTTKRKANKRMKHLEDANLDGPDQLLLSKD